MSHNFRRFLLTFLVVMLLNSCGTNADSNSADTVVAPQFTSGEPYGHVREELLKLGWAPVVSSESDKCMEGDARCTNRPEMEACSGTGVAPCKFVWQKENYILSVYTAHVNGTEGGDTAFTGLDIANKMNKK